MMMIRAVGLLCLALTIGAPPSGKKLVPVDESRRYPGLRAFRDRVADAARREDLSRLRPLISDGAYFGESSEGLTPDAFVARIRNLEAAERTAFWKQLRDALALGMASDPDYEPDADPPVLVAPYTSVLLRPWIDANPGALAITGAGVAVRERADAASAVIARLDYDVVAYGRAGATDDWVQIELPDKRVGWVAAHYVKDFGAPRFAFRKVRGVWKLIGYGTAD
jgi:hypothetical protein